MTVLNGEGRNEETDDRLFGHLEFKSNDCLPASGQTEKTPEEEEEQQFESSVLGTKEYWQQEYEKQLETWKASRKSDEGTIWFEETRAAEKMIQWIVQTVQTPEDRNSTRILDLGCGNGHLLLELAEEHNFTQLSGCDYSETCIQFAQELANSRGGLALSIHYFTHDILDSSATPIVPFDILMDKGTLDAISLSSDPQAPAKYVPAVACMLKSGGLLIITSCNWTEIELCRIFELHFKLKSRLKYAAISFGGRVGQTVSSVIFEKI